MNKKKLQQFKKELELKRQELLNSVKDVELDSHGDEVDSAQADTIGSVVEKISLKNLATVRSINRALDKISEGTFGDCEECGEAIDEKRLKAKLDAEMCIECAERLEKEQKQYARK
jgi:DnaK suppressor protein